MIAIIGGGISGLAAAYELTGRGIPFTLFEASDRLGGLVRTEYVDGFTIEAGADSMLVQKRAALDLCNELGLTPRLMPMKTPRTSFVLHRGQLHPLPTPSMLGIPASWKGLASYSLLPASSRLRMALEPLVPARRDGDDESIAAFFRRRFGSATVDVIAQPLLGGIHAGDVETLSLPVLFPRLAKAERSGPKVLRWIRQTSLARGSGGAFQSLSSGMGELVDAIRRRLPKEMIRLATPVRSVSREQNEWQVQTETEAARFGAVIVAAPAHAAARLLGGVDQELARLCAATRYVSTVSIGLGWPRDAIQHPLEGSGFVVARATNDVRITACTWVSSKWDGRAPAGHVLLRAYVGGAHDSDAVELTDQELSGIAIRELSAILSISGHPVLVRVSRWRDAGPQYDVGHAARMAAFDQRLAAHPGLFVTGSGFRSIGIPDCVADGRAVARGIPGSRS